MPRPWWISSVGTKTEVEVLNFLTGMVKLDIVPDRVRRYLKYLVDPPHKVNFFTLCSKLEVS